MEQISEKVLRAWLRLSTTINNERIVSDMPFNEALVCNILYRNKKQIPEGNVTATNLCSETKMLKSQMNRTLNSLEKKGIIVRERSVVDKRQVFVKMNIERADTYINQHKKILELVDSFIKKFGEEKAIEIMNTFNLISDMVEEVI